MTYIIALDIENLSQSLVQPLQLIHQQHANLNYVVRAMIQPTFLYLPDIAFYTLGVPLLLSVELGETFNMTLFVRGKVTSQSQKVVDFWDESPRNLRLPLAGELTAGRSTHRVTILMLVNASRTFLEVLVPTAMRGIVGDALRAPQTGLASELHGRAARTLRQGLPACGLRRHREARRLEMNL